MITYKSLTGFTVPFKRYQITVELGIELPEASEFLDELVAKGTLSKHDSEAIEPVVVEPVVPAPIEPVVPVEPPKV